jgi:hypothetical protein
MNSSSKENKDADKLLESITVLDINLVDTTLLEPAMNTGWKIGHFTIPNFLMLKIFDYAFLPIPVVPVGYEHSKISSLIRRYREVISLNKNTMILDRHFILDNLGVRFIINDQSTKKFRYTTMTSYFFQTKKLLDQHLPKNQADACLDRNRWKNPFGNDRKTFEAFQLSVKYQTFLKYIEREPRKTDFDSHSYQYVHKFKTKMLLWKFLNKQIFKQKTLPSNKILNDTIQEIAEVQNWSNKSNNKNMLCQKAKVKLGTIPLYNYNLMHSISTINKRFHRAIADYNDRNNINMIEYNLFQKHMINVYTLKYKNVLIPDCIFNDQLKKIDSSLFQPHYYQSDNHFTPRDKDKGFKFCCGFGNEKMIFQYDVSLTCCYFAFILSLSIFLLIYAIFVCVRNIYELLLIGTSVVTYIRLLLTNFY